MSKEEKAHSIGLFQCGTTLMGGFNVWLSWKNSLFICRFLQNLSLFLYFIQLSFFHSFIRKRR